MILLLNGAFGIGKTAVARALVARVSGSTLFDPEIIGIPLHARLRQRGADPGKNAWEFRRAAECCGCLT